MFLPAKTSIQILYSLYSFLKRRTSVSNNVRRGLLKFSPENASESSIQEYAAQKAA